MSRPRDPDQTADDRHAGLRTLRRYFEGDLGMMERRTRIKYIVEAATGALVIPAEGGFTQARKVGVENWVLFAPEESAWVFQASLVPEPIDRPEAEEACDRWAAYHGASGEVRWARFRIEGIKTETEVYDHDQVQAPNPLGRAEFGVIKHANADRDRLARACRAHAAVAIADPLCVGVDPMGIDIRARFGVVRLEFAPGVFAADPESARREVDRLLGEGGGA